MKENDVKINVLIITIQFKDKEYYYYYKKFIYTFFF